MTEEPSFSLSAARRRELTCDRFEAAWKAGQWPSLKTFLEESEERERPALLAALLELDLNYRRQAGETPGKNDYAAAFPEYESIIDQVWAEETSRHYLGTIWGHTTNHYLGTIWGHTTNKSQCQLMPTAWGASS